MTTPKGYAKMPMRDFEGRSVFICERCGAFVWLLPSHDLWHLMNDREDTPDSASESPAGHRCSLDTGATKLFCLVHNCYHPEAVDDAGVAPDGQSDYERTYDEFWRDIIEPDGLPDMDAVKRELHDFRFLMRQVSKVYDHVTGGRLSKTTHFAESIIAEADRHLDEMCAEAVKEAASDSAGTEQIWAGSACMEQGHFHDEPPTPLRVGSGTGRDSYRYACGNVVYSDSPVVELAAWDKASEVTPG